MMKHKSINTPIGMLQLSANEAGICRIHPTELKEAQAHNSAFLEWAESEIAEYFSGKRQRFSFPLSLHGTPFEEKVWQALMGIPYGEICTYGQIAGRIGMPKAARAVGKACGSNPLLLAVPCHRVIAASGALTGFAAGMEAKRILLMHEGHVVTHDRIKVNR